MIGLLSGIRVLECAVLPSGDQAGRLMGDLGAEVTKVEQPGAGDYIRELGGLLAPHNSPTHLLLNRNKRSLTLNLRTDEGREIFYRLLADTDVVVNGFAGDACDRLGIGYEDLRKAKPDIVYCQVSGYGRRGPYGQIPVHGYMMSAVAGVPHLEIQPDGIVQEVLTAGDRYFPGFVDGPMMGGTYGALTAIAALVYRAATGQGAYIDASGTDATIAAQAQDAVAMWNLVNTTNRDNLPPFVGSEARERPKYGYYLTKDDKFVMLAAIEHKFWDNFCRVVDRPDLAEAKYLDSPVDFHTGGRKTLADELVPIMRSKTQAEWMQIAIDHDIPISPSNSVLQTVTDPHLRAREIIYESVHPQAGPFVNVGWPAPVEGQPFAIEREAPWLGQHTDEILGELGMSAGEVAALRQRGVV
ncbi:CoA transferase [Mycobacterium timonense]|uniref:CoA transferase n=1 Tax=Mycobacterium bouchedurhonense TaxID=701041 RepID=A0AAW5SAC3_MYCBC|nr:MULTISPECIES: CaiB/BaiF CoA-transferase family protein [Mycobacterium avium complex (MAC)]MCV6991662.1 CoA transferase [Mycobacterium bouchedurhonense]MCV6998354.1 CoA transferase [Mycobacterium timonense]